MSRMVWRCALLALWALGFSAADDDGKGAPGDGGDHRVIVRFTEQKDAEASVHRGVAKLRKMHGVVRAKPLTQLGMAVVSLGSQEAQERFLDDLEEDASVELAVPDTWVSADDFTAPQMAPPVSATPVRSLTELVEHRRQCSANPACHARGLTGPCCPVPDGTMLSCCSMHFEPATVALGTFHATYVTANGDGGVSARSPDMLAESKFEMVVHEDDSVSLRTVFGAYLSAAESGWVTAVARDIGDREKFALVFNRENATFALGTSAGMFVTVEPTGHVMANRPTVDQWESFVISKVQGAHQRLPNDPDLSKLWGMNSWATHDIDAPEAWRMWTGELGAGIVVGVIDTGIDYTHEDLREQMWVNPNEIPGNGIDDDGNGYIDDVHGVDFANNDGDPLDDQLHGTHCSGTIAGVGDNGIGVSGVAWRGARLMALKFLSADGSGRSSDAISAIEYAIAHGARILSNSWGGGGSSSAMRIAIERAEKAGLLFIAAAGNSGTDNDFQPHYPSNYEVDNIISVASSTSTGELSTFSCFGNATVHLAAPGSQIYSSAPGNKYQFLSGTSMATPHVTGVAALLWMYRPQLSMQQVKQVLLDSVEKNEMLEGRIITGGLLNAKNALEAAWAFEPPRPPAHVPQGLMFEDEDPGVGAYAGMVTITAAKDESDIDYYRVYFVSSAGFQLEPLGDRIPATGERELVLNATASFAPPAYAVGLVVVSGRSTGEMSAQTAGVPQLELEDYGVPEFNAKSVSWGGDSDLRKGFVAGTLTIGRAKRERSISHYNVYWRDASGKRGDLVGKVPAGDFSEPDCEGSACELISKTKTGDTYYFERQPYADDELATISVSGPGNVTIVQFTTEDYYDALTVGGRELSGDLTDSLPMSFALAEGLGEILWASDSSVNDKGWAFLLRQFGAEASFYLDAVKPLADGLEVVAAYGRNEFPGEGLAVSIADYDRGSRPSSAFAPVSIAFADTDPAAGVVGGVATVGLANGSEAGGVTSYRVDFASAEGAALGDGWTVQPNGSDIVELLIAGAKVPSGATKLIARAQNNVGLSDGYAAVDLVDIVPVPPMNVTWSTDRDGRPGHISGDLTIAPASPEVGILAYVAYWVEGGTRISEAGRQAPKGFGTEAVIHFSFGTKVEGSSILVVSVYAWGEMKEGITLQIEDLESTRRLDEVRAVPPTLLKTPRPPAPMAGAEPWIEQPEAAPAAQWVAEGAPAPHQGAVSCALTIPGVDASGAAAREAIERSLAAELPGAHVRLLRVSDVPRTKAAQPLGGGRRLSKAIERSVAEHPRAARVDFIVFGVETTAKELPKARLSLDRIEARLIRLSHGGPAAERFDRSLAAALREAGAAPASALRTRVDEPLQLGARAAAAAVAAAARAPGRQLSQATPMVVVGGDGELASEEQAGAALAAARCVALALVATLAVAAACAAGRRLPRETKVAEVRKELLEGVCVDASEKSAAAAAAKPAQTSDADSGTGR